MQPEVTRCSGVAPGGKPPAFVTLAQRLLLATAILTIAATGTVGYGVREAWRRTEERRFQAEFRAALEPVGRQLERQLRDLPAQIQPICAHNPMIDDALVGLTADDLDRRLSVSLLVPELAKALSLDELWLVSQSGDVLGAHAPELVGKRAPERAAAVVRIGDRAEVRQEIPRAALAACVRQDEKMPGVWVGLLAGRHLDPVLIDIGRAYGIELSLGEAPRDPSAMHERIRLSELGDVVIHAARSRLPLTVALRELDVTILLIGGVTLSLALVFAFLLSRGLARPMVELARQAREVMQGDLRPIVASGPREIEESAAAFNRAIEDLAQLRKRLSATERIAAWREIARRVAHEIKNPLAPIRAAIETLRRLYARDDPAFHEYFDEATRTALEEVNRINHIVSEFTEFARMPPPSPTEVDVVELTRQVAALHGNLGKPLRFTHEPCPSVRADRDQIVQVLTNLIQNALDAVEGRPEPWVAVHVGPATDGRVRIRVRDGGPGIPPEIRERLFLPYATTKAHGTGLGLAIAQRLVVEHGGEIGFSDAEGGGTEFFFELPVEGPPGERRNPLVPGPLG